MKRMTVNVDTMQRRILTLRIAKTDKAASGSFTFHDDVSI
jgi:hypothetical protein